VSVQDGDLVAGQSRYRLLFLSGSSRRMTVRALRRLVELVDAGAAVAGRPPECSPSLADDDEEHARLCDLLWGTGERPGRVLDTDDVASALQHLGVVPTLTVDGAELLRIGRRTVVGEVVFLANPAPEPVTVVLTSTADGPLVTWDPVTLVRRSLAGPDGRHELTLPALGSVFVLRGGAVDDPPSGLISELPLDGEWRLELPGVLTTTLPGGPVPWTDLGPDAAGFSGVGTYTTDLHLDADPEGAVVLQLGAVGDLAQVTVNGKDMGVVWTAPWSVDVTGALRAGTNTVEASVANAWMNRLIAEAGSPTGEIFAPVVEVYEPDAPVRRSGLTGPVVLRYVR